MIVYVALVFSCVHWATGLGTPTPPPALIVTLRDAQGQGLVGMVIEVRDHSGTAPLSRAATDSSGQVRFAALPMPDVRVVVTGQRPDGTRLHHTGDDMLGIALVLTLPPTTLDLRIEPDGTVIPDPGSMIMLDSVDTSSLPVPTLLDSMPTVGHIAPPPPLVAPPTVPLVTAEPGMPVWPGLLLALGLVLILALLLMLLGRWRRES